MSSDRNSNWLRPAITIVFGTVGGCLGYWSGLPAGAMLGAIFSVGALSLITADGARLPRALKVSARILLGTTVGALLTPGALVAVGANIIWALIFTTLILAVGLCLGILFSRLTKLDLKTGLISFSPGGMPEMSALAEEVGARTEIVVGLHLARKILALAVVSGCVVFLGLQ